MYKKIYFAVISLLFLILFGFIFFNSLSYNLNTTSYSVRKSLNYSLPQGWGFFTKSPRDYMVDVYQKDQDGWNKIELKNSSRVNYFGASRRGRTLGMEISIVLGFIDDSLWSKCKDLDKLVIPIKSYDVKSSDLIYLDKKELVLVKYKTIPWAWRKEINIKNVPYEVVHVKTD